MSRITTCIRCQYFELNNHITGTMWCGNGARTWGNGLTETLEEIQIDCPWWAEKIEPITQGGEIYEQLSMF